MANGQRNDEIARKFGSAQSSARWNVCTRNIKSGRMSNSSPAHENLLNHPEAHKNSARLKRCLLIIAVAIAITTVLVIMLLMFMLTAAKAESFEWPPPSASIMGEFDKFAVTTDNTLCAHIGKGIISVGGNAVESAIASMFCLGAVHPQSSGLGGGFLMTIYNRTTGRCIAIDARETAPAAATIDMFVKDANMGRYGFKAIAVPGELAGYWEIFRRFGSGRVAWADLVRPTIKLLEEDVPVSEYTEQVMRVMEQRFRQENSMRNWINPSTNSSYKISERIPRLKLAKTLKRIAEASDPVQLFYRGEFADIVDREMRENGGLINKSDLENYRVRVHEHALVNDHFRDGLAVCGGPPPSGFAVTQLILGLMSNLYPNGTVHQLRQEARVYHDHAESLKFAYAQRTLLGDSAFVPEADELSKKMTTREFTSSILTKMQPHAQPSEYYGGDGKAAKADFGTSHVSILDAEGNGVSATSTVNRWFGAAVESEALGIIWNNEMDDFSSPGVFNSYKYAPSESNFIQPGKRPMSSMSPLVVYDTRTKKVRMVAGGSGGSRIISATAKALIRTLVFGENVKEAIDGPMMHNQFTPNLLYAEDFLPEALKMELKSKYGQEFTNATGTDGIVQAINVNPTGKIEACGDWRRKSEQRPAGV